MNNAHDIHGTYHATSELESFLQTWAFDYNGFLFLCLAKFFFSFLFLLNHQFPCRMFPDIPKHCYLILSFCLEVCQHLPHSRVIVCVPIGLFLLMVTSWWVRTLPCSYLTSRAQFRPGSVTVLHESVCQSCGPGSEVNQLWKFEPSSISWGLNSQEDELELQFLFKLQDFLFSTSLLFSPALQFVPVFTGVFLIYSFASLPFIFLIHKIVSPYVT